MGCIEAMIPSRAMRWMSSRRSTCACSRRNRASGRAPPSARSMASSATRPPRSPMAWMATWNPLAAARAGDRLQVIAGRYQQAEVAGVVAVGLEQRGAAAAQGAVGIELDAAHGEPGVGVDLRAALEPVGEQRRVVGEEDRRPQRQLAGLPERRVGPVVAVADPHVGHRGQPERHTVAGGPAERAPAVRVRGRGQPALGPPLGVVDQHAGGAPRLVAQEAAAGGVLDGGVDPQDLHRPGVDQGGVAVDAGRARRGDPAPPPTAPHGWGSAFPASGSGPTRGRAPRSPPAGRGPPRAPAASPLRSWRRRRGRPAPGPRPDPARCEWASISPGVTARPARSITRVFGPRSRAAPVSDPRYKMRPPRTARLPSTFPAGWTG